MVNFIIKTDDYALAEEKINSIINSMDNPDVLYYDLKDDNLYNLIDELTTVSLFDNPKLVILKGGNQLLSESDNKINDLCNAMADSTNSNVLIIVEDVFDLKSPERFKKYSLIRKYSQEFDLKVQDIKLDEYAKKSFDNDGYQISSEAINMLCNSSQSLSMLKNNIDKLKCYRIDEKNILWEDVDLLVNKPIDDDVYSLTNAVLRHDKKHIFELCEGFKYIGIKPSYLVSLLLNKFEELYNVHIIARGNVKQNDIATLFNISSGKAYYLLKDSKNQSLEEIKANLERLLKLDYDIKKGKIDEELGLEFYFLN